MRGAWCDAVLLVVRGSGVVYGPLTFLRVEEGLGNVGAGRFEEGVFEEGVFGACERLR